MKWIATYLLMAALALTGCAGLAKIGFLSDGEGADRLPYTIIDQEEAKRRMALDDGHVVVDVRRQDEYDAGHIPGAILIPNESIGAEPPEALPDFDQIILIYCRSGNRSKQAAGKLGKMGYRRVYEFGGINTWTGEIVTGSLPQPAAEDRDAMADALRPVARVAIEANGTVFYVSLADNSSAAAFCDALNNGPLEIEMGDYGGFEKVGDLPFSLPQNDEPITTVPGDLILYQGDKITIYYDENTWTFTRLGSIDDATKDGLLKALGDGDVTVRFYLEWSE